MPLDTLPDRTIHLEFDMWPSPSTEQGTGRPGNPRAGDPGGVTPLNTDAVEQNKKNVYDIPPDYDPEKERRRLKAGGCCNSPGGNP